MEETMNDMKNRFDNRLNHILTTKNQNSQIFTRAVYLNKVEKVKQSKAKQAGKQPQDYHRLRTYDVTSVGNEERLIVPIKEGDSMTKYYVYTEEIFQILHETHLAIGHGGRNRMEKELSNKYKNITREIIVIYLNLCKVCQKRMNVSKKDFEVDPTVSSEMNSRCQIDLIDMEPHTDGEYRFILVYIDLLTKFVQLRPLKTNAIKEMVHVILDILLIFGAPCILQSNYGREFAKDIIAELSGAWNDLKMVHGKETSTEKTIQDIKTILSSWLESNNTEEWSKGLRFVQFTKNREHHAGINCSPYEALFGSTLKMGLKFSLPLETSNSINSEEDLDWYYSSMAKNIY
ncbi:KRAB-A domain-containing protein 2-like [Agrilus planipennis]|uniref:KRAB-A domain-containing protein 2-like n=1 Tax=Agrilus planipennis TaxID=224129 RepID=A0A1W4XCP0_AGRPL|nr:KRAB-A domain-containing protein 2-like [Agrilus planipennis]